MSDPVRVLLAKPTQDCHDRGVRYVAKKMRDAGLEVIFTNFLLATEIVDTAVEEDVQVVGISSSSGGHMPVFEDLIAGLKENGLDDVLLIGGGVIPKEDQDSLRKWGVKAIFGPGATAEAAIEMIESHFAGSTGAPA